MFVMYLAIITNCGINLQFPETKFYDLSEFIPIKIIIKVEMEQFAKLFSKKLKMEADSTTPVVCSVINWYETQRQLMQSAYNRKEAVLNKNAAIAEASLKYRNQLQEKLEVMQKKHEKNRKEHLNKIKKTEERKVKYVQEVGLKHAEDEKAKTRERFRSFRQNQEKMEKFWSQQKLKRQLSYSQQVAAAPQYEVAVSRKKKLSENEDDEFLKVKSQLLKKHQNREQLVYKLVEKKQSQIHQPHNQQIQKNITKHQEIVTNRIQKFINDIGKDFTESEEVLLKKHKQLEKKIKDKRYDESTNMQTVRSNFFERQRNRSATLSSCKCKRINNVEQGLTKSVALLQKQRHMHFTQTLRWHQKNQSEVFQNRNKFMVRSVSMRSTVNRNQDTLRQRVDAINTERLKRQKQIADALALKKSLQVQGNCMIRLINVK